MNLPGSSPSSGCPILPSFSPEGLMILMLWPWLGGVGSACVIPGSSPIYIFPSGPIVSPLGMNILFQTSITLPSVSKTCTRWASRSATMTLSLSSTAIL